MSMFDNLKSIFDDLKSPLGLVEYIVFLVPGTILSLSLYMIIDRWFFKDQVLTKTFFIATPQLSIYLLFLSGLGLGVLLHILVLWHPLYKCKKISKIFNNKLFKNYERVKEQPAKPTGKEFYRVFIATMFYSLLFATLFSYFYFMYFYNECFVIISIMFSLTFIFLYATNRIFLELEIEGRPRSAPHEEKGINEIKK
jgi:hypothetical protein